MASNFHQSVLENISDAILLLDRNGIIFYANKSVSRILNISPKTKLNISISEFIDQLNDTGIASSLKEIKDHICDHQYRKISLIKKPEQSYLIEFRIDNMLTVENVNAIVLTIKEEKVEYNYHKSFEESQKRIWRQNQAMVNIGKFSFWNSGDLDDCFAAITKIASITFEVARVSIWMLDKNKLKCKYLLDKNQLSACSLISISEENFPNYFHLLKNNEIIDADEASKDERTKEYSENYLVPLGISSLLDAPIRAEGKMIGILSLEHVGPSRHWHVEEKTFAISLADVIALAIASSERKRAHDEMINKVLEQEKTLMLFRKYVPEEIIHKVIHAKESSTIFEGELRNVTVLFCDIRNFTGISEILTPSEVVAFLNTYYTLMSDIVKKYKGSINQYVGDEVFAAFGAPVTHPENEINAVLSALEMIEKIEELNKTYQKKIGSKVEVGIGINAGEAIAGNLGSEDKIEYSITGDTVNTGKRIETLTKDHPNKILISESVYQKAKHLINVIQWDPIEVKGKSHKIVVYEITGKK